MIIKKSFLRIKMESSKPKSTPSKKLVEVKESSSRGPLEGEKSMNFFPGIEKSKLIQMIKSKNEVEAKFRIDNKTYYRLEKFFSQSPFFDRTELPKSDVYISTPYRKIVIGELTSYQVKRRANSIIVPEWGYKIVEAKEENIKDVPSTVIFSKDLSRTRFRTSYQCPREKIFFNGLSIDLTRVINDKLETYELEIEIINEKVSVDKFINSIKFMYMLIQGYDHIFVISGEEDFSKQLNLYFKFVSNIKDRKEITLSYNKLIAQVEKSEFSGQLRGEIIQKYFIDLNSIQKKDIYDTIDDLMNNKGMTVKSILKNRRFIANEHILKVVSNPQFEFDLTKLSYHKRALTYDDISFGDEVMKFIDTNIIKRGMTIDRDQRDVIFNIVKQNKDKDIWSVIKSINNIDDKTKIDIRYMKNPPAKDAPEWKYYESTQKLDKILKTYKVEKDFSDNSLKIFRTNLNNFKKDDLLYNNELYATTSKIDGVRSMLMTNKDGAFFVVAPDNIFRVDDRSFPVTLIDGELYRGRYYTFDIIYSEIFKGIPDINFLQFKDENTNIKDDILEERWDKLTKRQRQLYKVPPEKLKLFTELRETYEAKTDVFEKPVCRQLLKKRLNILSETLTKLKLNFIVEKQFNFEGNFYDRVQKAFEENMRYNKEGVATDGIVFQPIKDTYQTDRIKKWKPEITIDFKVIKNRLYVDASGKNVEFKGSRRFPYNDEISPSNRYIDKIPIEGKIVEFRWGGGCFQPLRFRYDRPIPNKEDIAIDNWNDINEPISEESIRGNNIKAMRLFHNDVKSKLLESHISKGSTILDIGSGRGGDLGKWKNMGYKVYIVEPSQENIEEIKRRNKIYGVDIKKIIHAGIEDTETIVKNMSEQVDAIVSFFSLTFLQKDEQSFQGLVETVSRVLKPGGKFLGIVLDGEKVYDIFERENKDVYQTSSFKFERVGRWNEGQCGNKLITTLNDTDTMVKDTTEYLFFFDPLVSAFGSKGIKIFKPEINQQYIEHLESDSIRKAQMKNSAIEEALLLLKSKDIQPEKIRDIEEYYEKELKSIDELNFESILEKQIPVISELTTIINLNQGIINKEFDESIFDYIKKEIEGVKSQFSDKFINKNISILPKDSQEFSSLNRIFLFTKIAKYENLKVLWSQPIVNVSFNDIKTVQMYQDKSRPVSLVECLAMSILGEKYTKIKDKPSAIASLRKKIANSANIENLVGGLLASKLYERWKEINPTDYKKIVNKNFEQLISNLDETLSDSVEVIELLSSAFDVNIFLVSADTSRFYLPEIEGIFLPIKTIFKLLYKTNRQSVILVSYNDGFEFKLLGRDQEMTYVYPKNDELVMSIQSQFYQENSKIIDDYPYKKTYRSVEHTLDQLKHTQNYTLKIEKGIAPIFNLDRSELLKYQRGYSYMLINKKDYEYYGDDLSDVMGFEKCRVTCRRSDQKISSYQYWQEHKVRITKQARELHKKGDYPTETEAAREILYKEHIECASFKPYLMTGLMKLHKVKRVLDFSSGWGDRLIGALVIGGQSSEYTYVGVDPNGCVHQSYKRILEFYKRNVGEVKMNIQLIQSPFEKAEISGEFDAVITSPPYFDLEIYSSDPTQSIHGRKLEDWFKLLMSWLYKAFDLLKIGGHLIININDKREGQDKYTLRMVREMNKRTDVEYLGCLPQWNGNPNKSGQPFWIWRKYEPTEKMVVFKEPTKREISVSLVPLSSISKSDITDLQAIAEQKSVQENIGKVLDIAQLKEQSIKDLKLRDKKYYHYAIKYNFEIVGYFGLHPFNSSDKRYADGLQFRIFVGDKYKGMGIGKQTLILFFNNFLPTIGVDVVYAVNAVGNEPANRLSVSAGMKKVGEGVVVYKKPHNIYKFERPRAQKSVIIRSEYFENKGEIIEIFKRSGWEYYNEKDYPNKGVPTLVYEDGKYMYSKNSLRIPCKIKNQLGDSKKQITDKSKLYEVAKEFMMKQYSSDEGVSTKKLFGKGEKTWIIKPVGKGFYKGKGIEIVTSEKEYNKVIGKMESGSRYVVSRYIQKPMLYNSRKFHIRVHVLVGTDGEYIIINEMTRAILALKPYKRGDYNNKEIHDTHFTTRENTVYDMGKVLGKYETQAMMDISNIVDHCVKSFKPEAYSESEKAFEVFGFDFMVTSKGKVKLLEINDKSGIAYELEPYFSSVIQMCDRLLK